MNNESNTRVALITGGSAGLGRALAAALAESGWRVITDARDAQRLADAALPASVRTIPGDITDADHKSQLVAAVAEAGHLDLLVHNASTLGPLPMRPLSEVTIEDLQHVWRTNIGAPLVLTGELLPYVKGADGVVIGISSDAAREHYPTWGLYGASKSALDHVVLTYGAEAELTAYAFDPGDMRTQMHQNAFPDEDISDRPLPETVIPALLALIEDRPESGRYQAADLIQEDQS